MLLAVLLVIAVGVTGCVVYNSISGSLPDPSKPLRGFDQTTKVLDRHGKLIVDLFAEQNRTNVLLKDMPPFLLQAVIATEDERYYQHPGVDLLGMLRALLVDIRAGANVQGGSTITQQYVKTAFITPERTVKRKASEVVLAYRLEQHYTKNQILEMYLNTIYFGHGAYGVQSASRVYFGKDVGKLTVPEAALLAGVIKSPRRYSPHYDAAAAKIRRDTVLGQMRDQAYIDESTYAEAVASPIKTRSLTKGSKIAPYFVEYLKEKLVSQFGEEAVYRQGLRVKTTLDLRMQKAAESAVREMLDKRSDPSAALVAIDPKTGQILAMVGGRDFQTQQYNVAVQGANRQTGSSFKPFVLVTALEEGISPEQTMTCGPVSLPMPGGSRWRVTGAGGGRKGVMRLREATVRSVNSVFAQLVMKVGAEDVVKTANRMGITRKITPVPAVALGGMREGVTPLDMASAYGTLAAGGKRSKPYAVLEVLDGSGKVLTKAAPSVARAIRAPVAYLTTDILRGVISSGTGTKANIGRPAAGKTGTTQENRDAWFVGYTPDLVAAVWVGYVDNHPMNSVHGISVTGGTFPARIWAAFMRKATEGMSRAGFARPSGLADETICLESGGLATEFCPKTGGALFLAGHLPDPCALHVAPEAIRVPDLVGMQKPAAISALQRLQLRYVVQEREIAGVTPGTVASQSPRAGSRATTATTVTLVVASSLPEDTDPVAAFKFTPKHPSVGAPVRFDAGASSDDGTITKYLWEFGDGTEDSTSGEAATHSYASPGRYDATLWVTDDAGNTASFSIEIPVR